MYEQAISVISAFLVYTVISVGFTFVIAAAFFGYPEDDRANPEYRDQ